jgi:hypothetical protein
VVREGDDILITSGCQQAFDLLQRTLVAHGETVLLEDPVFPGLVSVFSRASARIVGIPVGMNGIDVDHVERVLQREPARMLVVTASFQNPTGTSLLRKSGAVCCRSRAARARSLWRTTFTAIWRIAAPASRLSGKWTKPGTPCCCAVIRSWRFQVCESGGRSVPRA